MVVRSQGFSVIILSRACSRKVIQNLTGRPVTGSSSRRPRVLAFTVGAMVPAAGAVLVSVSTAVLPLKATVARLDLNACHASRTPHEQVRKFFQEREPVVNKRRAILPLVFSLEFILVSLVLGLLGMHILGVDHQVPHAAHGSHAVATGQGGISASSQGSALTSAMAQHATVGDSRASFAGDSLCDLKSVLNGRCVLALSLGGIFFHLVARAFRQVPGQGMRAPPVTWAPKIRARTTPSLVQLSISRT